VVLAAEPNHLVGVDVMRLSRPREDVGRFFDLMDRQFTAAEWVQIRGPGTDVLQLVSPHVTLLVLLYILFPCLTFVH